MGFMLLDSPEDVVFTEILLFTKSFNFPPVNLDQTRNKSVNFGYLPFK